ncbi:MULTISPECIES: M50 family metallopeptidase [unclassified Nodularia (in: cyanobacteria)]|uniref:M50 family metallopeptidase n=1 Tax=unclassified Nodularia (in: cyanobacteria) TaxID=2656917 RepID=UPI00187E3DCE|nr:MULTISPECIES: M50 family metallopeptidase [unclassified Nodularia (in: cyanobacteria)]MBE9198698.1 M50 family metallopeptidase [Nodularia sp. LEGE 06071]MCC2694586.1 M50 family metallopeptidase [Nodularia sp. LEGE 04288]
MKEPGKDFHTRPTSFTPPAVESMGLTWLIAAAIATILLWQIPGGDYILYPFSILATWFHEMGHGLMALLLGGRFHQLQIFSNGSGVATYSISRALGPIGPALVAAAGPMGPSLAGAGLILASRTFTVTSLSLKFLGGFLLLSTLLWVRSWFGLLAIPILGIIILGISLKAPRWIQEFAIQFLGVQACVSVYHQINYLFSYSAGPLGLSDTGQMQKYLLLPYWFWGGLMAIASLVILAQSLRIAYRSE